MTYVERQKCEEEEGRRTFGESFYAMAANDYCRLCKVFMKEEGRSTYGHSTDIFHSKKTTTISERLALLGVVVPQETDKSNRCCQRCTTAIGRLERDLPIFRQWEEEFRDSGSGTAKREREPTPSKTPRALKKTCPNPPSPCATSSIGKTTTQVTIKYPSQTLSRVCNPEEDPIIKFIALKRWKEAARDILKHKHLQEEVKVGVIGMIREECEALCSRRNNFMLWRSKPADLKSFSFHNLRDDLHRLAPFLLTVLNSISNNNTFTACTAAAIALRGRQPRLAAFSYYLNTILQYGGAKKSVFNRLSKLSITTSHSRAIKKQQEMAIYSVSDFQQFKDFKDLSTAFLEASRSLEDLHLSDESTTPAPTEELPPERRVASSYSIIMDNLDFFVHTHNQSINNRNKSIHWIHHIAVRDRINVQHLSNIKPTTDVQHYKLRLSLPQRSTQNFMRREFIALATRILTQHMPAFKSFGDIVVHHIPHLYSSQMSTKSADFPLGLIFKDENKRNDLVDVLKQIQQEYMPTHHDGVQQLFIGGDRLTEANSRNVQWGFSDAHTEEGRMEGMHFKFEDWHAIRVLFEIHHKIFFKESAKDHGTLFANMTRLRCSTAKSGPRAAFNAYRDFVIKDATALFLAAVIEHLGLQNVTDDPGSLIPEDIKEASPEARRSWFNGLTAEIVDKYVLLPDITEAAEFADKQSATPIQKNKFPCRAEGCLRTFTYFKSRQTHELKTHNLVMPTDPNTTSDHKYEHTVARLGFSFVLLDFLDAVKEGDGERLMRLYTVALLFYKAYGHTSYAYSTFLLTVQLNATLSPRVAHSLKWNRFWSTRGGKGRNISLDLHLEHLNGFLKSFLKGLGPNLNESSAARISRSIGVLKDMMAGTDGELGISRPTGAHHLDMSKDILTLVEILQEAELFKEKPGRVFTAFPDFRKNLLSKLDHKALWKWMTQKLTEWRCVPL